MKYSIFVTDDTSPIKNIGKDLYQPRYKSIANLKISIEEQ